MTHIAEIFRAAPDGMALLYDAAARTSYVFKSERLVDESGAPARISEALNGRRASFELSSAGQITRVQLLPAE